MEMTITLDGNKKVSASFNGYTVKTDQPAAAGGDGTAPSPFDLFLASVGTCAGFYVTSFCQSRGIESGGIKIIQKIEKDPSTKLVNRISLDILLPSDFPEKYREAVINAAGMCTVKKHLAHPPEIKIAAVQ